MSLNTILAAFALSWQVLQHACRFAGIMQGKTVMANPGKRVLTGTELGSVVSTSIISKVYFHRQDPKTNQLCCKGFSSMPAFLQVSCKARR